MLDYEENGLGLEDQENEDLGMEDNQDYGDEHLYDENEDGFTASDDPMMPEGEMTFVDTDGDGYTETTVITYDDINEDGVVRVQEIHSDTDGDGIDDYHAQYVELDTNGSGEVDTVVGEIDTDGDGVVDRIEQYADTNNSGEFDTKYAEYDSDGDGLPDTAILANDYDQDGNPDNVKIYTDENRDGRYDTKEKQFDSTGDGELDSTEYYVDENADEPVDYDQMYDYDSETNTLVLADDYDEIAPEDLTPEEYEKLMYLLSIEQYDPSTVSDPDMIIGNPDDSLEYWQAQAGEKIDGFTPEQRFYLSYGRIWAENITPEAAYMQTKSDPHSLGEYRVNATLRNIDTFFKAFDIKPGAKMWLDEKDRTIIW